MKVAELGEFGLIELLAGIVSSGKPSQPILVGIGDDASVWQTDKANLLATTDALVQGVHFAAEADWTELGWKAMAINLSDIAAMGGIPQYALISLSLPGEIEVEKVRELYWGMKEAGDEFAVVIAGGNITSAPLTIITISLIGMALNEGWLSRSSAKLGEQLAVTGCLGSSAAGLRALSQQLSLEPETMNFLRKAHFKPQPRVSQGQILVQQGVRTAIDISDGLLADLNHLCQSSQVGAKVRVDCLPIHPIVKQLFPQDSIGLALAGGEDYELLFTASPEIIKRVAESLDCPVSIIGEIIEGEGINLIDEQGRPFPQVETGWEHFISRSLYP
jgi:thiamine-monophosphate kinase